MPVVTTRDLRLTYGERVAIEKATIGLPSGALTAVIGPNGSGKSTLLRAISGLHPIASGELRVLGGRPNRVHRQLAHVLQSNVVNESVPITAREVVSMGCYARTGLFGRSDRCTVDKAMGRLGVTELGDRHLSELSGGQRQRVLVAQALAQEAELLLLDEPVTGLDLTSAERIEQILAEELGRGRSVVLTTHDLDVARRADHVVLLATQVVGSGPPDEVLTDERLAVAYGGQVHELGAGSLVLDEPIHH